MSWVVRVSTALLMGMLLLVGFACGGPVGPADHTNAVAAYVHVSADRFEQAAVVEALVHAEGDERASPAGFIEGLRSTSSRRAADGVFGWEIIFQRGIGVETRSVLAASAAELGLDVIWLHPDDEWPYCAGSQGCQRVKESGNFP